MKIAIIGSGFFGIACAFELSNTGHQVTVYEKENEILQGASKKNQLRFHLGYHYPRSQETVDEVKKANKYFTNFYTKSVFGNTKNYYAISKNNSKISLIDYLRFAKKNQLSLNKSNIIFNSNKTSDFYLTKEKNLNYFKFKKILKKKIAKSQFKIKKKKIFKKKLLKNYDRIIVCCYSQNNSVLNELGVKNLQKYQYELVEKILIKLPKYYKNKSFIVLDGQFVCLDPFLGTDYHLLSDVKFSKLEVVKSKYPTFKNAMKKYISKKYLFNEKKSNFEKFINNSIKYLPFLKEAKFIKSYLIIRTLSLNNNSIIKDERLSYINRHSKKIFSILAGKWNTSISVSKKLSKIIDK